MLCKLNCVENVNVKGKLHGIVREQKMSEQKMLHLFGHKGMAMVSSYKNLFKSNCYGELQCNVNSTVLKNINVKGKLHGTVQRILFVLVHSINSAANYLPYLPLYV